MRGLANRLGLPNRQLEGPVSHSRALESGNQIMEIVLTAKRISNGLTRARVLESFARNPVNTPGTSLISARLTQTLVCKQEVSNLARDFLKSSSRSVS